MDISSNRFLCFSAAAQKQHSNHHHGETLSVVASRVGARDTFTVGKIDRHQVIMSSKCYRLSHLGTITSVPAIVALATIRGVGTGGQPRQLNA